MPKVLILSDCLVSGAHHGAGEVIDASEGDAEILIGCGRAEADEAQEVAPAAVTLKPVRRTKAQIEADLATAKAAEAALQADLTQATD